MKKIIFASVLIGLMGSVNVAMADAAKGQKIYTKMLKTKCGMSGVKFASSHSQSDWSNIMKSGKMEEEVKKLCPDVKGIVNKEQVQHLFDFAHEYASDSGNVPAC